jgi:hypothetical protein
MQVPDDQDVALVVCPACKQTVQVPPRSGTFAPSAGPSPAPARAAAPDDRGATAPAPRPGVSWVQIARHLPLARAIAWAACWVLVLLIFFVHLIRYGSSTSFAEGAAVAGDSCAWMVALYILARAFDRGTDLLADVLARHGQPPAPPPADQRAGSSRRARDNA